MKERKEREEGGKEGGREKGKREGLREEGRGERNEEMGGEKEGRERKREGGLFIQKCTYSCVFRWRGWWGHQRSLSQTWAS